MKTIDEILDEAENAESVQSNPKTEILFNIDSTTNSVAALQSTMDAAVTITDNADNGYTYRIVIRIERSEGDIGDASVIITDLPRLKPGRQGLKLNRAVLRPPGLYALPKGVLFTGVVWG